MRRWMASTAALGLLAATVAFAQERGPSATRGDGPRGPRPEMSRTDREAFSDARIAALHAGLKLTPDQEKLWPPVEEAVRGLVRERAEAREARRERFASLREGRERGAAPVDVPAELRFMADRQAASSAALRKLADATAPLYASLDDGQKRRAAMLGRGLMGGGRAMRGDGPRLQGRWE